jgi:hypothetical protein
MNDQIPSDVARQIADCLYAGQKIQAIKLYREHSGQGLKEAKDFVDSLEAALRAKEPEKFTAPPGGKGCLVAVLALGASVLALLVWAAVLRRG